MRRRLTLLAAAAVAATVVLASLLSYVLVRNQLRGEIDNSLRQRSAGAVRFAIPQAAPPVAPDAIAVPPRLRRLLEQRRLAGGAPLQGIGSGLRPLPVRPGEDRGFSQLVTATGRSFRLPSSPAGLPVTPAVRALAARGRGSQLFEVTAAGQHLRVIAVGIRPGQALETARSLRETDAVLSRLRLILVAVALGGIAIAALLGRFVAGTTLAPMRRLTEAAEHVALTQDLDRRIDIEGRADELGRLARAFNSMLDALDRSMRALDASARSQRQLVADASHELRTPVTSLRTNLELLQQRGDALGEAERARLMSDLVSQLEELSALVGDLVELARDEEREPAMEDVAIDELVHAAVLRARRNHPEARFEIAVEPTLIRGVPARLERAVGNLLDNAVKFAGDAGPIDVVLKDRELMVRDRGPGIAPDDVPLVFDRFFRGAAARALPGNGLGLAIVRQVAALHGGSVSAAEAVDGGAVLRLRL
ncbi:MAG: ATP-binding protein [Solirubrobacteraceae bacterium]